MPLSQPHHGDDDLVREVRLNGEHSPQYRYLQESLRELGIGTLIAFDKAGKLFSELNKCRISVPLPAPVKYQYYSRSLIQLAVEVALRRFMRKQVMDGGWKSNGGASLETYFVGSALRAYAEEYRRFFAEEHRHREILTDDPGEALDAYSVQPYTADPADTIVARDLLERVFPADTPGHVKDIFVLTSEGYSQVEIGEKLKMSKEAVSSAVRRYRRILRKIQEEEPDKN